MSDSDGPSPSEEVGSLMEEQVVVQEVEPVEENPEKCCICIEAIDLSERSVLLPCGHEYHKRCIDQWFNTSGSMRHCSYCRRVSNAMRHTFMPDGSFQVQTGRCSSTAPVRLRFLMSVITPNVYMYTLVSENVFTLLNASNRTVEVVNNDSQLVHSIPIGSQLPLPNNSLNFSMRFEDEPQIEFSLFNMDNFYTGTIFQGNNVQTSEVLRQEFVRLETIRSARLALIENPLDDEFETPRMRRRRERIELSGTRGARGGRGRRGGGRRGGRGGRGGGASGLAAP